MPSSFHSWVCETLIGSTDPGHVTARLVAALIAFIHLQVLTVVIPANYGRYADAKMSAISGIRFSTRWSWVLQEAPAFLIPFTMLVESWSTLTVAKIILLAAFLVHYFNRSFVFPFAIRGATTTPLLPTVTAVGYCSLNGFFQAHSIVHDSDPDGNENYARMFAGLALFIAGFIINFDSDKRLRKLRSTSEGGEPEKKVYSIPRGGFFEYVSAANYFGEIVEWTGFAIASGHIAALLFAASTGLFLIIRGIQHHRFYKERFSDYPAGRKAVIPYIL